MLSFRCKKIQINASLLIAHKSEYKKKAMRASKPGVAFWDKFLFYVSTTIRRYRLSVNFESLTKEIQRAFTTVKLYDI